MTEKFRSRFGATFLFLTVFSQLGYLALMIPFAAFVHLTVQNGAWVWWAVLGGCGGCGVLSLALTPVVVWCYPVYVSPGELKAYNFWGVYRTPTWDDVTRVRPVPLGVVSFLLVSVRGRWLKLWLPLFLDDTERFADRVREYAGPDHPLSAALDRYAASDE